MRIRTLAVVRVLSSVHYTVYSLAYILLTVGSFPGMHFP